MKTCTKCGETKPLDDFGRSTHSPDGFKPRCKTCSRADWSDYYRSGGNERRRLYYQENAARLQADQKRRHAENPEQMRAYWRARYQKDRERHLTYARTKLDPVKAAARKAVLRAVRMGQLVRGPCVDCGGTDRIHGHHDDYAKPLEVVWLCSLCHGKRHRRDSCLEPVEEP